MSKNNKRIAKLLTRPGSLNWDEVEALMLSLGFATRDAEGSHFILYRPEDPSKFITVSRHGKDTTTIYKIKAKKLYISIF